MPRVRPATRIPPLAFGQGDARLHEDARSYCDLMAQTLSGIDAYEPMGDARLFRSRTAAIALPTATVVATSNTPLRIDRRANPRLTFLLSQADDDQVSTTIGGQHLRWGRRHGGVFMPQGDQRVQGTSGHRSQLMWQLDVDRLLQTAQRMLATDTGVDLRLDQLRLLPQSVAGLGTDAAWRALLPMLQLLRAHPGHLAALGVEDLLYRHTVMLLRPDLFESAEPAARPAPPHRLDALCERLAAHPSEALTLSDLERLSGLSARTLQLAFKARFGVGPMQWWRQLRLDRVRQALRLQPERTVEAIAFDAGFASLPAFFKAYRERFGETPGDTRRTG